MGSLSSHVKIAVKNTKQGNTKIQCDGWQQPGPGYEK